MQNSDVAARRDSFRKLHDSGCFVIPNPWDVGSARFLQHLGFQALATTSGGFAFSRALSDGAVTRENVLRYIAEIVSAVGVPVNADFESGFAASPEGVASSVALCVETGVAGISIEDSTGNSAQPLYELPVAIERLKAARSAIDVSRTGVMLVGRAECYLTKHPDAFKESIRRLQAYAEAGADVLYAPGVHRRGEIQTIVRELAPKPVNVLAGSDIGLTVADLAELGVRRISTGSALARTAWTGFMRAAQLISNEGSFKSLDGLVLSSELNNLFRTYQP
jgi:2-methylisocitrate lyase-like PEP mutase family enzyme